jgi:hypothetical protein
MYLSIEAIDISLAVGTSVDDPMGSGERVSMTQIVERKAIVFETNRKIRRRNLPRKDLNL